MKIVGENPFVKLEKSYGNNMRLHKKTDDASGRGPDTVLKEDRVELSQKAKDLQEAKKLLNEMPDVREEKVALLKKQIEDGSYRVDGEKVAGKMLEESLLNNIVTLNEDHD
jgi:negative regulator of flagellin synthesis FlgM